jgi:hypothetical protein
MTDLLNRSYADMVKRTCHLYFRRQNSVMFCTKRVTARAWAPCVYYDPLSVTRSTKPGTQKRLDLSTLKRGRVSWSPSKSGIFNDAR